LQKDGRGTKPGRRRMCSRRRVKDERNMRHPHPPHREQPPSSPYPDAPVSYTSSLSVFFTTAIYAFPRRAVTLPSTVYPPCERLLTQESLLGGRAVEGMDVGDAGRGKRFWCKGRSGSPFSSEYFVFHTLVLSNSSFPPRHTFIYPIPTPGRKLTILALNF